MQYSHTPVVAAAGAIVFDVQQCLSKGRRTHRGAQVVASYTLAPISLTHG